MNMNAVVFEFPMQRPEPMECKISIEDIATAPRDGTVIMAVDLFAAAAPRWLAACWSAEDDGWFLGSLEDHADAVAALNAGEIGPDDFECCFFEAPTHWFALPPIPSH